MNTLFEAAREVCAFMEEHGWKCCVIGGLAVQRWGEPRTTLDADIALLTGWGGEEAYIDALLDRFASRIEDGRPFAVAHRVLLLRASNGRDVDVTLGALPFEEEMMARSTAVEFAPGVVLPCCAAEDLLVMKLFAARPRDWADAEGIVARQRTLDRKGVLSRLAPLCELKDAPDILDRARRLLEGAP